MKKTIFGVAIILLTLAFTFSLVACGDDPKSLAKQAVELGKEAGKDIFHPDPKLMKKLADIEKKVNNLSEEDKQIYITEYTNLLFNHTNKEADVKSERKVYDGDSKAISTVKKNALKGCPKYTVEEMVNATMEKLKWEHGVDENGIDYVNVSGLTSSGRPANVSMQFWVRKNELGIQAIEIDKVPQDIIDINIFILRMCEYAEKAEFARSNEARVIPTEPSKEPNNSKKEENLLNDSRDGKNYKIVKIGTQTWMAENLNYNEDGSKCYSNSESNCQKYGRLYNWATATKACPNGWRLPSNAEWDALYRFADGTSGMSNPYESETAGKYLKAASGWNNGGNGNDAHGFAALPGGLGNPDGSFSGIGDFGYWWDASELNAKTAYRRSILHFDERAYWRQGSKSNLLSVRCVKE